MNRSHHENGTGVMLKRIGAAAVCATLAVATHMQAEAGSSSMNGRSVNGVHLNGGMLSNGVHLNGGMFTNGVHLNGMILPNGVHLNGANLPNGVQLNGASLSNGRSLNGVHLNGPNLNGRQPRDTGGKAEPSATAERIDSGSTAPIEVPDDRRSGR